MTKRKAFLQAAEGTRIAQAYGKGATATVTIDGVTSEELQGLLRAANVAPPPAEIAGGGMLNIGLRDHAQR
jgi:hypothetical protein